VTPAIRESPDVEFGEPCSSKLVILLHMHEFMEQELVREWLLIIGEATTGAARPGPTNLS